METTKRIAAILQEQSKHLNAEQLQHLEVELKILVTDAKIEQNDKIIADGKARTT